MRANSTNDNSNMADNKPVTQAYGAPFVKILYLTDLAQKLVSLRIFSYLSAEIAISARI